jgi:hypothetical protein
MKYIGFIWLRIGRTFKNILMVCEFRTVRVNLD